MKRKTAYQSKNLRKKSGNRKVYSFMVRFTAGVILTFSVMAACFLSGTLFSSAHGDTDESASVAVRYYKSIEIQQGDTLWAIASENMDESYSSVYDYMEELIRINQLNANEIDHLRAGDYLTISYVDAEEL